MKSDKLPESKYSFLMTEVELSFPHGKGPGSVIKPADLTVVAAAAQNVRVLLVKLDTGEVAGGAEHAPAQRGRLVWNLHYSPLSLLGHDCVLEVLDVAFSCVVTKSSKLK